MATLAIKGHATRGREVIELLEMLGGKNAFPYDGNDIKQCYWIDEDHFIQKSLPLSFTLFTLEEFLEKFPYKVGDKVNSKYLINYEISKMEWGIFNNRVLYRLEGIGWHDAKDLQPYKEETMNKAVFDANAQCCDIMNHLIKEENMEEIKVDIPKGYEFAGVDDDRQQVVFTKIHPQYPKTYKECCEVLGLNTMDNDAQGYKADLIIRFQELLIARDAYWKIAGDWKPDWRNNQLKYVIVCGGDNIINDTYTTKNCILAFPTSEMRDTFYENFKDLIENCKELL